MELDHIGLLDSPTSWLELSRANLLHNLTGVRALVGETKIMAVVKANAYGAGAGAVGMAQVLAGAEASPQLRATTDKCVEQAAGLSSDRRVQSSGLRYRRIYGVGVDAFGVATVAEGVELRRAAIGGTIVCLTNFTRDEADAILDYHLTPSIFTLDAARLLAALAINRTPHSAISNLQSQISVPVWIKIDTGLGRLGVPFQAAPDLIRALGETTGLEITGLFSTLTENPERDPLQVQRLLHVRRAVPELVGAALSLASSHGVVSLPASYLDVVRPGILLHGLEPSERERMNLHLVERADLRPIATWKAHVGFVRTIAPGEQIGYGYRPALADATRIAILTVGWATGYSAGMSQGGAVLIQGCRCPVMAVSANSTLVDLSGAPEVATNSEAVLLGKQADAEITATEMAHVTGGSVYRLLAAVPRDVPRLWR